MYVYMYIYIYALYFRLFMFILHLCNYLSTFYDKPGKLNILAYGSY